jgi:hypothetical protein
MAEMLTDLDGFTWDCQDGGFSQKRQATERLSIDYYGDHRILLSQDNPNAPPFWHTHQILVWEEGVFRIPLLQFEMHSFVVNTAI